MAATFKLWNDASMTQEFNYSGGDALTTDVDNIFYLYLGSNDGSRKLQAASDPGVDDIILTPTDSNPGSGHEASEIKLATTSGGLAGATPGAALNLGPTINGGAAQQIWIELTDGTGGGVNSTELSIEFNPLVELAI